MKKKLGTPKPSLAEINLAKTSGKTAAHIAARKKVARNYLENNGFSKDQIKDALGNSDGTIIGGVDLNKPIEISSFPPPDTMTQYVKSHGYPGNWFDPKGTQTADSLGISDEGRKLISVKMPKGDGLSTHSKPILDTWTNPKNPIQTHLAKKSQLSEMQNLMKPSIRLCQREAMFQTTHLTLYQKNSLMH